MKKAALPYSRTDLIGFFKQVSLSVSAGADTYLFFFGE